MSAGVSAAVAVLVGPSVREAVPATTGVSVPVYEGVPVAVALKVGISVI